MLTLSLNIENGLYVNIEGVKIIKHEDHTAYFEDKKQGDFDTPVYIYVPQNKSTVIVKFSNLYFELKVISIEKDFENAFHYNLEWLGHKATLMMCDIKKI